MAAIIRKFSLGCLKGKKKCPAEAVRADRAGLRLQEDLMGRVPRVSTPIRRATLGRVPHKVVVASSSGYE